MALVAAVDTAESVATRLERRAVRAATESTCRLGEQAQVPTTLRQAAAARVQLQVAQQAQAA
jgi:hypothetical protein